MKGGGGGGRGAVDVAAGGGGGGGSSIDKMHGRVGELRNNSVIDLDQFFADYVTKYLYLVGCVNTLI